jgi:hypothetical protein
MSTPCAWFVRKHKICLVIVGATFFPLLNRCHDIQVALLVRFCTSNYFSYRADILSFIVLLPYINKVLKVGALQEVRSDLTKLRGALFYKILEDLHCHLYNSGEYR